MQMQQYIEGPITRLLTAELNDLVRKHAIVVWLDSEGAYTPFTDTLAARGFSAPVIAFRGSWLEVLTALDGRADALDPEPLLIHLPGWTQDTVVRTPILELYRAGHRHQRALHTLIKEAAQGQVGTAELNALLAEPALTLERAEAWLRAQTDRDKTAVDHLLEGLTLEWILESLLSPDDLEQRLGGDLASLADHLYRNTGLDEAFINFVLHAPARTVRDLSDAFVGWLLCVEYTCDLSRHPQLEDLQRIRSLPEPIRRRCLQLLRHLRDRHPDSYERAADQTELLLQSELDAQEARHLGKIDTFRREDMKILEAAVDALAKGRWDDAHTWASDRSLDSFWLRRDRSRRMSWALVQGGADLGKRLTESPRPLKNAPDLRTALDLYASKCADVDRAHRLFEQERLKTLSSQLPHFAKLLVAADRLRDRYRSWADDLARDFNALCTRAGFIPDADLQQRTLYEQVVHPLLKGTDARVAVFMVDAFRYEMAKDLIPTLQEAGATVRLDARYAELPTITPVGMNALAPVSSAGRLTIASPGPAFSKFSGFRTREYTVSSPHDRARAMGERSVGQKRLWRYVPLANVVTRTPDDLSKSLQGARLVVVHSTEIDDAGEANVGLATFETWLSQLKTACQHLKSAGITEFVFTADHGFLLQDQTTREERYGSKSTPDRRHVISAEPRRQDGMVTVSLNELGYDGADGWLLLREDTAVFARGKAGATFVHGGNSLQERIIPVLTVSCTRTRVVLRERFTIKAEAQDDILGYSRLKLQLVAPDKQQLLLASETPPTVDLILDSDGVQVNIKQANGNVRLVNQTLRVQPGEGWTEVLFALEGPQEGRARVTIVHPENLHEVPPARVDAWFTVRGVAGITPTPNPSPGGGASDAVQTPESAEPHDWTRDFSDEGVRIVFEHLHAHGSITEEELITKLGSPRKVRRFSVEFDEYLKIVPFSVRVETVGSGKRYVRE